ncbi:MAG: rane fusion protein multidrug efflux system [Methylobacteriaceae bacterium]|jgi:membrane fusion protein (multidrug efflux system)|nr:rane fusion protein multidrug efflux system [Methylobacteriaceae bacterium]
MRCTKPCVRLLAGLAFALLAGIAAWAQPGPAAPPAVGVVEARKQAITQTNDFNGRIEAIDRVNIVARVTAFLEKRLVEDGAEVKKSDLLYQLEKGPFEADVQAHQAQVAQLQATLTNAHLTTERARTLLGGPAGLQSNYDAAIANERSLEAQIQGAQAQLKSSQISLGYTDIRSPIDGRIGRTQITIGNVVSPSSGVLTTIVSQDPMYVTFPVSFREALELRQKYLPRGGLSAVVIHIKLPDGRLYGQTGKLDFVNNTIAANTDTITLRGEIANPLLDNQTQTRTTVRELYDGEFVSVQLEGVQPVEVLAVPRAAILSDQQGDYVYVVGADNKAEQRRIQLGQSTSTIAAVISGLKDGEHVIVEGLQRVRPAQPVSPGPASPQVQATMATASGANHGAPAPAGAPPGPAADASGPKAGTTANAPATVAPPAGQASSGTVGGAQPPMAGNPSSRH